MKISIIIPTYNSEDTLKETLNSVINQTYKKWESILVDDGSMDKTCEIVEDYAEKDKRIKYVRQIHGGVSNARNLGIDESNGDWLMFLDSDDLLIPICLEKLTNKIYYDTNLDAVHCRWIRFNDQGEIDFENHCKSSGYLFPEFARGNVFGTISACLIKKSAVNSVNGFDSSYPTCQDWHLWQKVSRIGVKFGRIDDVLVQYRMRMDSVSSDINQMLDEGIKLIRTGHTIDESLKNSDPLFYRGLPLNGLSDAILQWICWPAGLMIGRGQDVGIIFDKIKEINTPNLNPHAISDLLYESIMVSICKTSNEWQDNWLEFKDSIFNFLNSLEAHSKSPRLALKTIKILENKIFNQKLCKIKLKKFEICDFFLDINKPINDIRTSSNISKANIVLSMGTKFIGNVEIPVFKGLILKYILVDAIANKFSWEILSAYFESILYKKLKFKVDNSFFKIYREEKILFDRKLDTNEPLSWPAIFKHIGWTLFLQELWGLHEYDLSQFYLNEDNIIPDFEYNINDFSTQEIVNIEVSEDIPINKFNKSESIFLIKVGGIPLDTFKLSSTKDVITPDHIIGIINRYYGKEIFRLSVREAIIGKSILRYTSLRNSLRESASYYSGNNTNIKSEFKKYGYKIECFESVLRKSLPELYENTVFVGRRSINTVGSSVFRRNAFPIESKMNVINSALKCDETVIGIEKKDNQIQVILYAPELLNFNHYKNSPAVNNIYRSKNNINNGSKYDSNNPKLLIPELNKNIRFMTRKLSDMIYQTSKVKKRIQKKETRDIPIIYYKQNTEHKDLESVLEILKLHMEYLYQNNYYSTTFENWNVNKDIEKPLPGNAILIIISFDDIVFLKKIIDVIEKYNYLPVILFEYSDTENKIFSDINKFELIPELILRGFKVGIKLKLNDDKSYSISEISSILSYIRADFKENTGTIPTVISYDSADPDEVFVQLLAASGYLYGLTDRFDYSSFYDSLLKMPTIQMRASDKINSFVSKLNL